MNTTPSADRAARRRFLRELAALWPLAKGSVAEVRKPCIRPRCPACAAGHKHRAVLFTYRDQGRTRCLYVPADLVATLRQAVANGRQLEQRLARLGRELIEAHRRTRRRPGR
jgi:hypothetical protein